MNRYALSFLIAPAALFAAAAPAPAFQTADKMDKVVAHMQKVGTMSANFTQTDRQGRSVSGRLLLKRPGHVRFEYQKDTPLLVVADGKALTMIDYEVKQVQRWPIKNSPLTALLDPGQDLRKFGKLQPTANNDVINVEVTDPKRPEYGTMTFTFTKSAAAPSGYALYGWTALDSKNNRTTVRLTNVKYNIAVSNSAFGWKDPRPARRKAG
jgi:outer membrane lipoprotein-sorting protein